MSDKPGENLKKAGKKMENLGCYLTFLITIPMVLTALFGLIGLGIGIIFSIIGVIILSLKSN